MDQAPKPVSIYDIIGITKDEVVAITSDINSYYISYVIRKSDGKSKRIIDAPQEPLRGYQKKLLNNFLYKFRTNDIVHGFVARRSAKTNAEKHLGAKTVVKVDISNFFNSIREFGVTNTMQRLLSALHQNGVLDVPPTAEDGVLLTQLVCYKGRLPQGAPTSPAMANIFCWGMDKLLSGVNPPALYHNHPVVVTRYADDITISSTKPFSKSAVKSLLSLVRAIVKRQGLRLNAKKTRVRTASGRLSVTGVVVNSKTNMSKGEYRVLRARVHNFVTGKVTLNDKQIQSLRGQLEWLRSLNPSKGEKLIAQLGNKLSSPQTKS